MQRAQRTKHRTVLLIGSIAILIFLLRIALPSSDSGMVTNTVIANTASQEQQPLSPCADGQKNQDETDVDCGGRQCTTRCSAGQACITDSDCGYRMVCEEGLCGVLQWHQDGCEELIDGHNDPSAENLNIVFAGIGYSEEALQRDAKRAVDFEGQFSSFSQDYPGLLFYEPLRAYSDRTNFWYIDRFPQLPEEETGARGKVEGGEIGGVQDCRSRCGGMLGEEYCDLPNRQMIYLCDAKCEATAIKGGPIWVGRSPRQPYEVVHSFGHSFGFLDDRKDDSVMGNYLRLLGRRPHADDFGDDGIAQIRERLERHRGKDFEPWYMIWIVFDRQFNIIAAREKEQTFGETRRLAAPYILRMYGGRLSYVFDFDIERTVITDSFSPRQFTVGKEQKQYIEVPLPLKISRLSEDRRTLLGYDGKEYPYTIDVIAPDGSLLKRLPGEELAKFLVGSEGR